MSKTFAQFGPDPPLSTLPSDFLACLTTPASLDCDNIVGKAGSGNGYCAQGAYQQTTYCACVNNVIPCPMVAAAACANSAFAYTPTKMTPPNGEAYLACKGQPICINLVAVGGNQNVVSGITQECGTIEKITDTIAASPSLAAIAFVLLVMLVILLSVRPEDAGPGGPGAPPPAEQSGVAPAFSLY
jgi:hypothetical protein